MSIVFGDCRTSMIDMIGRGERVQMCVTSPPYFGLRDYGHPGQLGLEQTPAEYVANMVEVFSLVWYLLADDGVLWLNLGDSYFSTTKGTGGSSPETSPFQSRKGVENFQAMNSIRLSAGELRIKPKDLIGIPWRVAFALQEAGWYLRQDIIWAKPNPMPESVTDRCTKAHEYMFLLTKSERYYFDNEAIKEPAVSTGFGGISNKATSKRAGSGLESEVNYEPDGTRNRRSVWTIATKPYKGAHFATFPPALIEPCILAGSRPGDVVFDPFMGRGTTAQVALQHGRRYLGCELNPEYEQLQKQRTGT
jgi:DNA modification methylase